MEKRIRRQVANNLARDELVVQPQLLTQDRLLEKASRYLNSTEADSLYQTLEYVNKMNDNIENLNILNKLRVTSTGGESSYKVDSNEIMIVVFQGGNCLSTCLKPVKRCHLNCGCEYGHAKDRPQVRQTINETILCERCLSDPLCSSQKEIKLGTFQAYVDKDDRGEMATIGTSNVQEKVAGARLDTVSTGSAGSVPYTGDILDIVKISSRINVISWSTSIANQSLLVSIPIEPMHCIEDNKTIADKGIRSNTNLSYYADCYNMWRGSLVYDIEVVASQFHQGQLFVAWVPVNCAVPNTLAEASNLPSTRIDISDKSSTSIEVPFISNTHYKRVRLCDTKLPFSELFTLGHLNIYVLSELTTIETMSNSVEINVYVRAGNDFTLHDPRGPSCDTFQLSEKKITNALFQSQVTTDENTDAQPVFDPGAPVKLHTDFGMQGPQVSNTTQLEREFFIHSAPVTVSDLRGTNVAALEPFPSYMIINNRLTPYHIMAVNKYIKCDIEMEIRIPPTRFHQGMLIMYFVPAAYEANGAGSYSSEAIMNFPHCKLNIAGQTSAKMIIPYCGQTEAWSNGSDLNLEGTLYVKVWNGLEAGTGSSTSLTFTLWAKLCNTEVAQAIPYAVWQGSVENPIMDSGPSESYNIQSHTSLYDLLKRPSFIDNTDEEATFDNKVYTNPISSYHYYLLAPFSYFSGSHKYKLIGSAGRADSGNVWVYTINTGEVGFDKSINNRVVPTTTAKPVKPMLKPMVWWPQENNEFNFVVPQYFQLAMIPVSMDVDSNLGSTFQLRIEDFRAPNRTKSIDDVRMFHSIGNDFSLYYLGAPRRTIYTLPKDVPGDYTLKEDLNQPQFTTDTEPSGIGDFGASLYPNMPNQFYDRNTMKIRRFMGDKGYVVSGYDPVYPALFEETRRTDDTNESNVFVPGYRMRSNNNSNQIYFCKNIRKMDGKIIRLYKYSNVTNGIAFFPVTSPSRDFLRYYVGSAIPIENTVDAEADENGYIANFFLGFDTRDDQTANSQFAAYPFGVGVHDIAGIETFPQQIGDFVYAYYLKSGAWYHRSTYIQVSITDKETGSPVEKGKRIVQTSVPAVYHEKQLFTSGYFEGDPKIFNVSTIEPLGPYGMTFAGVVKKSTGQPLEYDYVKTQDGYAWFKLTTGNVYLKLFVADALLDVNQTALLNSEASEGFYYSDNAYRKGYGIHLPGFFSIEKDIPPADESVLDPLEILTNKDAIEEFSLDLDDEEPDEIEEKMVCSCAESHEAWKPSRKERMPSIRELMHKRESSELNTTSPLEIIRDPEEQLEGVFQGKEKPSVVYTSVPPPVEHSGEYIHNSFDSSDEEESSEESEEEDELDERLYEVDSRSHRVTYKTHIDYEESTTPSTLKYLLYSAQTFLSSTLFTVGKNPIEQFCSLFMKGVHYIEDIVSTFLEGVVIRFRDKVVRHIKNEFIEHLKSNLLKYISGILALTAVVYMLCTGKYNCIALSFISLIGICFSEDIQKVVMPVIERYKSLLRKEEKYKVSYSKKDNVTNIKKMKSDIEIEHGTLQGNYVQHTFDKLACQVKLIGMGFFAVSTFFVGKRLPKGTPQGVLNMLAGRTAFESLSEGIKWAQSIIAEFFDDETSIKPLEIYVEKENLFEVITEFYTRRDLDILAVNKLDEVHPFLPEGTKISKLTSREFLLKCRGHIVELDKYIIFLHKYKHSTAIKKFMDDVRPLLAALSRNSEMSQGRIEPVCLWLAGESGVGKSMMISTYLPAILLKNIGISSDTSYKSQIYSMPMDEEQKYYDGYANQAFAYYDDFSARSDGGDYSGFLQFASTGIAPLNMASLEEKGRVFTSSFICVSSNERRIETKKYKFETPFARRIPFAYNVLVKEEYAVKETDVNGKQVVRLNSNKMFTYMNKVKAENKGISLPAILDKVWEFQPINLLNKSSNNVSGPSINFSQVCVNIIKEYNRKKEGGALIEQVISSLSLDIPEARFQSFNLKSMASTGLGYCQQAINLASDIYVKSKNWYMNSEVVDKWTRFYRIAAQIDPQNSTWQKFKDDLKMCQISLDYKQTVDLNMVRKFIPDGDPFSLKSSGSFDFSRQDVRNALIYVCYLKTLVHRFKWDSTVTTFPDQITFAQFEDKKFRTWDIRDTFEAPLMEVWEGIPRWIEKNNSWIISGLISIVKWSILVWGVWFLMTYLFRMLGFNTNIYQAYSGKAVVKRVPRKVTKGVLQSGDQHAEGPLRYNIVKVFDIHDNQVGHAVLLDQYHIVLNKHVMELCTPSASVIKIKHMFSVMSVPLKQSVYRGMFNGRDTDTVIVRLPKPMPRAKKISHYLVDENILTDIFNLQEATTQCLTKTEERYGVSAYIAPYKNNRMIVVKKMDKPSSAGDCGFPYLFPYSVCTKQFIGIHAGEVGTLKVCEEWMVSPVTTQMFQVAEKMLERTVKVRHVEHVTLQGNDNLIYPEVNSINDLGRVELNGYKIRRNVPNRTSKVKSKIYSQELWPDGFSPAPVSMDILMERFKVYDRDDIQSVARDTSDWCLNEYWKVVKSVPYESPRRPLFEEEILNPTENYPNLKSFDIKSSAGYWSEVSDKKEGILDCELREEGNYYTLKDTKQHPWLGLSFKEHVEQQEKLMKQGKGMLTLWVATLKDEVRTEEKVKAKRTRVFQSGGFDHAYLCKKYFGAFADFYRSNPGFALMHGIGNDKEACWGYYRKIMENHSDVGFDVDGKDFGASINDQASLFMQEIAELWYMEDSSWREEDAQVRAGLLESVRHSLHIVGNNVVETEQGNNDGFYLTDMYNSLVNVFYMMSAFVETYKISKGEIPPQGYFLETVRMLTYGDDVICVPNERANKFFNRITCAEILDLMGITVTSAKKDDVMVPLNPISELTFLKSFFKQENSITWAPMPESSIWKQLNWHNKSIVHEAVKRRDVAKGALDDACHRGREFYEETSKQVVSQLEKFDPIVSDLYVPTYEEQFMRISDKQREFEELEGTLQGFKPLSLVYQDDGVILDHSTFISSLPFKSLFYFLLRTIVTEFISKPVLLLLYGILLAVNNGHLTLGIYLVFHLWTILFAPIVEELTFEPLVKIFFAFYELSLKMLSGVILSECIPPLFLHLFLSFLIYRWKNNYCLYIRVLIHILWNFLVVYSSFTPELVSQVQATFLSLK